ncbi:MAG: rhamnulose-1-phosphate aldolase [candidate division WOR-3 bacterium]
MERQLGPVLEKLARIAGLLWQKGWAEANAGNISINLTGILAVKSHKVVGERPLLTPRSELAGQSFLVTATGSRMRDLAGDPAGGVGLITISEDGEGYHVTWQGAERFSPSSELDSHLAIHGLLVSHGSDCRAVLHAHPDELIAVSLRREFQSEKALNELLMSMHPEATVAFPEGVGLVPYVLPGSDELLGATMRAFKNHRVVIWANHGAISVGRDLEEAFDLMDILNKMARIFLINNANQPVSGLGEK